MNLKKKLADWLLGSKPEPKIEFPSFFLIRMMQENKENGDTDCERVVGSEGQVERYAGIFAQDGLPLEMLEHFLTETYLRSNILTDGERKVAREVGELIPKFLADCYFEVNMTKEEREEKAQEAAEEFKERKLSEDKKRVF